MSPPLGFALCAALCAAAAAPAPLAGQRAAAADGFWASAGVGGGWLRAWCDICAADRGGAVSGFVRLGGRVRRDLLVGAEAQGWQRDEGTVRETVWAYGATALWYPARRRPLASLFWRVGAGVASYRNEDGQDALTTTALGVQLGAGYDLAITRHLYLSPAVGVLVASWGGALRFNGAKLDDQLSLTLVHLTVGVTRR